jgi:hypothetical protein
MRKSLFLILIFCATFATAAPPPNPADYTETLHVTGSHLVIDASNRNTRPDQRLDVTVDGKKYELYGESLSCTLPLGGRCGTGVLRIGDYKARRFYENLKPDYLLSLGYQILLPDGKTIKLFVVGQDE